jgi:hypothetical protein
MDEQYFIVREVFAYYGRSMYVAQTVEKGIMNIILFNQHKNGITKTRYDELLHEKSLLTFGQLKREIQEMDCFTDSELDAINEFHEKRDFLAHSYWWERAVEFYDDKLQYKLLEELNEYTELFKRLNEIIENKINPLIKKYGIDLDGIQNEMVSQGKTVPFESFRKLSKNEVVVEIFGYKNAENSLIPIFKLKDNTNWTVCEIGLTQYKFEIVEENKFNLKNMENVIPINQFNPRPKVKSNWNYELDLKKKCFKMIISRENNTAPMKWKIKNTVANQVGV